MITKNIENSKSHWAENKGSAQWDNYREQKLAHSFFKKGLLTGQLWTTHHLAVRKLGALNYWCYDEDDLL